MRGQRNRLASQRVCGRIIPARAGPTIAVVARGYPTADHPRSCGANFVHVHMDSLQHGSSPLVRGQLGFAIISPIRIRIIPARAGPTLYLEIQGCFLTDHPRSCGANVSVSVCHCYSPGSSPLVRGQPMGFGQWQYGLRIIPARAGPTICRRSASTCNADHPRSCGANMTWTQIDDGLNGSSPLVRGQPPEYAKITRLYRIIPARAGPTV